MKRTRFLLLPAIVLAAASIALAGCKLRDSVASRSDQALRDAMARGESFAGEAGAHGHGAVTPPDHEGAEEPVSPEHGHPAGTMPATPADAGGAHGGHAMGAAPGADEHAAMGHAPAGRRAAGTRGEHAGHAGAQPPAAAAGRDPHAGHAGMRQPAGAAPDAHAGHQMTQQPGGAAGHAGHAAPAAPRAQAASPHAGHAMPPAGAAAAPAGQPAHAGHQMGAAAPPAAEPQALAAQPGQPAATLTRDPLDAPASTSVAEAQRAATLAVGMAGHGHGGHGGTYRHLDAGRGPASAGEPPRQPAAEAPPDPHQGHDQSPEPPGAG